MSDQHIVKSCYLCQSDKSHPYGKLDASYAITPVSNSFFQISKCQNCGFIFTSNLNVKEIMEIYKSDNFFDEGMVNALLLEKQDNDALLKRYQKYRITPIKNFLNNKSKVKYLDIGCANGYLLDLGKRSGWEAEGIEPSKTAVEFARRKYGLPVHHTFIDNFEFAGKDFDVISLYHVVEHLEDPRASLKKIASGLKKGGLISIEVPNINSFPAHLRKNSWHCYCMPYHLWHFSRSSMTMLLDQVGFDVVYSSTPYAECSSAHIINVHGLLVRFKNFILGKRSGKMPDPVPNAPHSDVSTLKKDGAKSNKRRELIAKLMVLFYFPTDWLMSKLGVAEDLYILARKR